jgi:hypothetical protein
MSFSDLPNGSDGAIKPFKIETPKKVLDELKTLVQYSKIAVPTFENSQKDGKYGLSREWLESVKAKWADFDWYGDFSCSPFNFVMCTYIFHFSLSHQISIGLKRRTVSTPFPISWRTSRTMTERNTTSILRHSSLRKQMLCH